MSSIPNSLFTNCKQYVDVNECGRGSPDSRRDSTDRLVYKNRKALKNNGMFPLALFLHYKGHVTTLSTNMGASRRNHPGRGELSP
jgi:hypothetical protein